MAERHGNGTTIPLKLVFFCGASILVSFCLARAFQRNLPNLDKLSCSFLWEEKKSVSHGKISDISNKGYLFALQGFLRTILPVG